MQAILFKKCLGYTDSSAVSTQGHNFETGETQLIGCANTTTTDDGAIEKIPALVPVVTHTNPITSVSSGQRMFFSDSINTYEYVGGTTPVVTRFPLVAGPMIHTPVDVRLATSSKVYKSANPTGAVVEATVGTNPDPDDSIAYAGQPVFDGGFVLGSRLYGHKGKFLTYSKGYHYDLWDIGDGFIGHQLDCLRAGAIPSCVVVAHAEGISLYLGGDPMAPQTIKKFYPCSFVDNTLYSGFISKALGHGHIFLCADGIYMAAQDGSISRLTESNLEHADSLNSSYVGAVVVGGKYLAYGNNVCLEYDFRTKAVMLRTGGMAAVCQYGDTAYVAAGTALSYVASTQNESVASSVALPYAYLGSDGRKSFSDLYFTGELTGDMEIVCRDQTDPEEPIRWTIEVSDLGVVQNRRIKLPKGTAGSKVSFQFNVGAGRFRMEEARIVFESGNRR